MESNNYVGKDGTSIKIVTEKLKELFAPAPLQNPKKRKCKNSFKTGNLKTSDIIALAAGLDVLHKICKEQVSNQYTKIFKEHTDTSKFKYNILNYQSVMFDFLSRIRYGISNEFYMKNEIDDLSKYYELIQAARDGILIKQETRLEIYDGIEKEFTYDTSMTENEVFETVNKYSRQYNEMLNRRLINYLGLGMGFAGALGTIVKACKRNTVKDNNSIPILTIGTIIPGCIDIIQNIMSEKYRKDGRDLRKKINPRTNDLFDNEQISIKAMESEIDAISSLIRQDYKIFNSELNLKLYFNIASHLVTAILSGIYVSSNVQLEGNGKLNGKALSAALIDLSLSQDFAIDFFKYFQKISDNRKEEEEEFKDLCKKVSDIWQQMDEKVYPLEGATRSFDELKITNFEGKFYPKKNYETGQINYSTVLNIPEFSIKRGDVVLLSGESGAGKSTFLRFLKRGDINNRKAIVLDNIERVDHLGDEYISFRPSIDLGNETNVLYQLTGKENISDLTAKEKSNLLHILKNLKFSSPDLLQELASKKFMEFSTGQQRRLALSKLFYRIDDGASAIIVDEPVGNVEDKLIREQLEMIKKYAMHKNVMLILTTHRLDLAEDLATKKYHIDNSGLLKQIPVKLHNRVNTNDNIDR